MKPKKTESVNDWESLDRDGFVALPGAIQGKHVMAMKTRLEQLIESTPQDHAGTLIVGGLIADPVFDLAWNQPLVLSAIESVLGPDPLLLGVSSRGLQPGHGQQALHSDWGGQGQKGVWYICHAICALVDFTPKNGATRVIPTSHKNPWMTKSIHDPRRPHPAEIQLTGKAGTVFILNVHCLHSAVHNASDSPRLAIFASFSRRDSPLLSFSPHKNPDSKLLQRFDDPVRRLLTYDAPD